MSRKRESYLPRKEKYFANFGKLIETTDIILVFNADNISGKQLAQIRVSLRGKGTIMMGKNSMMRPCIKNRCENNPKLETLLPFIKLNVGLVFCQSNPCEIQRIIAENKAPAQAKQGVVAPSDVVVPAGPTRLDPSQTSFFQALGIATKLVKGQVEITGDVKIIKKGERVNASQCAFLKKLNIKPFQFGLEISSMYDDGNVHDPSVLSTTQQDILERIEAARKNVAAISMVLGLPDAISFRYTLSEAIRNCVALGLETDYKFKEMDPFIEAMKAPQVSDASQAGQPCETAEQQATKGPEPKEEEKQQEEEEEEENMGFSLFD